ncbi:hypothetical protein ACIP5Y_22905 [Nocardia sp. NPDC088792]|uniref:hypothetical protein n=1 Tax=Nocardia sp. NPDC088792 TaxID=3364332 RepID=UPI00381647D2
MPLIWAAGVWGRPLLAREPRLRRSFEHAVNTGERPGFADPDEWMALLTERRRDHHAALGAASIIAAITALAAVLADTLPTPTRVACLVFPLLFVLHLSLRLRRIEQLEAAELSAAQ